jgi:hypothetical protein
MQLADCWEGVVKEPMVQEQSLIKIAGSLPFISLLSRSLDIIRVGMRVPRVHQQIEVHRRA